MRGAPTDRLATPTDAVAWPPVQYFRSVRLLTKTAASIPAPAGCQIDFNVMGWADAALIITGTTKALAKKNR